MVSSLPKWRLLLVTAALMLAALFVSLPGDSVEGGMPGVTVRAGSDTVPAGQQVTIPVDALDVPETPGQGAFTVEVEYDTSLLVGVGCEADPGGAFDMAVCSPVSEPGVARCTGASASGVSGAELRLCDITFQAAAVTEKVITPLEVNCPVKTDPVGNDLDCSPEDGEINIQPPVVTVRVGEDVGVQGGNATVPVEILGLTEQQPLGSATVDVQYDPAYPPLLAGAKDCQADPDGRLNTALCSPFYDNDDVGPDIARCTGAAPSGVAGDLVLCTVSFSIEACIPGSVLPLGKVVVTLDDANGDPIFFIVEPGKIQCGLQGDVDCDGDVDAIDALFILQYVVGFRDGAEACPTQPIDPEDPINLLQCDVQKDEDCDATDANLILQCVLALEPGASMPFCAAASASVFRAAPSPEERNGLPGAFNREPVGDTGRLS